MKFKNIIPLRPGEDVEKYLANTQRLGLLDLLNGLQKLDLLENFEAFEYEGTIAAGAEVEITNELVNITPTSRIILRNSSDGAIVDGSTAWDINFVYLKNTGSIEAVVKAIFLR